VAQVDNKYIYLFIRTILYHCLGLVLRGACICVCMLLTGGVDQISRAELRLTDIADALQSDWVPLARQLGLTQPEIIAIQRDYTYVSEQVITPLRVHVFPPVVL